MGSLIQWRTWCGPTRATVVSYGQGIYGAASVSLRCSDGYVQHFPSGLPKGWTLAARPMEPRGYDVPCDYNQCPHFARFLVDERGAGDPAQVCERHA